MNGDAMIIPKMMILFCFAFYLMPQLLIKKVDNNRFSQFKIRILIFVAVLIILQMLLVLFVTDSPIEQQVYGRSGRGLGFITYSSLIILLLVSCKFFVFENIKIINFGLMIACTISSTYAILQKFGIDLFEWKSRTNGIIGTIGNPNFQSSFAAMALASGFVFFYRRNNYSKFISLVIGGLFAYTIYICQSTQGYISVAVVASIFSLLFFWYWNRMAFLINFVIVLTSGLFALIGMINIGPLAPILYKYSIESRGEMWRSATAAIKDNPFFGIGLDSFGDYSQMYKNVKDAKGVNEWADNAHNHFLEYAVTGGLILTFLHILILIITFYSFIQIQKKLAKFDAELTAIFAAWAVFQAQSFISPATIPLLTWNFIISGAVIGISIDSIKSDQQSKSLKIDLKNPEGNRTGFSSALIAGIIIFPLFNNDRILENSLKTGNVTAAVKAVESFPQSTMNYRLLGTELIRLGYQNEALVVARAAVKFNPNSFTSWALLFSCENSTEAEKRNAILQLTRIDPTNATVKQISAELKITDS